MKNLAYSFSVIKFFRKVCQVASITSYIFYFYLIHLNVSYRTTALIEKFIQAFHYKQEAENARKSLLDKFKVRAWSEQDLVYR